MGSIPLSQQVFMKNKWTLEKLKIESSKYLKRIDFQRNSHAAYEYARSHCLLDDVCSHMRNTKDLLRSPRLNRRKWSEINIVELAKKCKSRSEFKRKHSGAHKAASRMGILENLFVPLRKSWAKEELFNIALKYESRGYFQKYNRKAYEAAHSLGILDEICLHMKRTTRISNMELELMNEIKNVYLEAKTLKNYKVNIKNKPHIKRFEIDIFIKSINKGIEFDGTYHHSIEGLSRGRKHWPLKDLKNYHKIKDKFFLSKGIKIIHIKEEDWIKDKNLCIKLCLEFLYSI